MYFIKKKKGCGFISVHSISFFKPISRTTGKGFCNDFKDAY